MNTVIAEIKTLSGRVYPKGVLEKAIAEYQKKLPAIGQFGPMDSPNIDMERASHEITKIEVVGDKVMAELRVLRTPYWNILKQLIEANIGVSYSIDGTGVLDYTKDPVEVKDFMMTSVSVNSTKA